MSITTRDFTEGGLDTHIKKLSLMEVKHDFGNRYSVDRIQKKRGNNSSEYFPGFKINNYRKAMELNPSYSHYFDGCSKGYSSPEAYGLEQAALSAKPTSTKIQYPADANKDPFYESIATLLNAYRVNGKIPLVIDVQRTLNKDSNVYPKRQLINNFVVCKNKEHYADPSRTYTQNFGEGISRIDIDERGSGLRTYTQDDIHTGGGNITLNGSIDQQTINYGTTGWKEIFKKSDSVAPNTITLCTKMYETLSKTVSVIKDEALPYCDIFKRGVELPLRYPDMSVIKKIGAQLLKKRCGDQLQVASCIKEIQYVNGKTYGGLQKPCVFWSYDRLAIAFAVLKGIPCVYQLISKSAIVYIPNDKMRGGDLLKGGAPCTRSLLEATRAGLESSESLVSLLNRDSNCLNKFIELHFDFNQAEFNVRNILNVLKYGKNSGWPGYDTIDSKLFSMNLLDNEYDQVYTEGDEAIALPLLEDEINILFYSPSCNLSIYMISPTIYEIRFLKNDDHTQIESTLSIDDKVLTGDSVGYLNFISEEDNREAEYENYGWGGLPFILASRMLGALSNLLGYKQESMSGGGTAEAFIQQYQAFTVIMANSTPDTSTQKEYKRFGSLLMAQFLNTLCETESKLLVFKDLSEAFMCLDSSDIPKGGYTSYELVLFIQYLCEIDDPFSIGAFSFLPNILRELGDGHLLSEIEIYMSRFTMYKNFYNDEAYAQLPDEFKKKCVSIMTTILDVINVDVERIDTDMLAFDEDVDKMYEYLNWRFPHGFIKRHISRVLPSLEASINDVPNPEILQLYTTEAINSKNERPSKRIRVYGGKRETKKRRYGKNKTHRLWSKY